MLTKKLTAEDLRNATGGGEAEMMEYCNELCSQYGLEEGDLEGLLKVCTKSEYSKLFDLCFDINISSDFQ